jgi:hypothetical protein
MTAKGSSTPRSTAQPPAPSPTSCLSDSWSRSSRSWPRSASQSACGRGATAPATDSRSEATSRHASHETDPTMREADVPTPRPDRATHARLADDHIMRNRSVLGIGLGSLLSDTGHEMATAAMPGFLSSIGAQAAALGVIEGIADASLSASKVVGGVIADRPGVERKTVAAPRFTRSPQGCPSTFSCLPREQPATGWRGAIRLA